MRWLLMSTCLLMMGSISIEILLSLQATIVAYIYQYRKVLTSKEGYSEQWGNGPWAKVMHEGYVNILTTIIIEIPHCHLLQSGSCRHFAKA